MQGTVKGKAYIALSLVSIIWGTTWVVSKIAFRDLHPIFYAGLRQLIAGCCFVIFFLIRGKASFPSLKEWGYLVMMALLMFVISNAFTIWGISYINSGLGAILGALFPLFVAIIEWIIGAKARPNLVAVAGLFLGITGVGIIFYEHLADFRNSGFRFGILLSLIACLSWAVGTIITSKKLVAINPYYGLGLQMIISGTIIYLFCLGKGWSTPLTKVPMQSWLCIGYMVVFASIIAFVSFIYTLQHLPTTLAAIYAYINPVVAVFLGHIILKESWSVSLMMGAIVTLAGVYLVNRGFNKYVKDLPLRED